MPLRSKLIIAGITLAVLGAIATYLFLGGGPDESTRLTHASGYSIIPPAGWKPIKENVPQHYAHSQLRFSPERWQGMAPFFTVLHLLRAPEESKLRRDGFRPSQFQDQPSWVFQNPHRQYMVTRHIFERSGQWFEVNIALPRAESLRLDYYMSFANTFRYTPVAGLTFTLPADLPAEPQDPFTDNASPSTQPAIPSTHP